MYALKVLSGGNAGKIYSLNNSEMIIGRSPQCSIAIPNKNISKKHAKIIIDKSRILFTDLNSTNGSFVNGIKVEVTLIKEGDKIALYDTLLEVVEDSSSPQQLPGSVDDIMSEQSDDDVALQYASPVEKMLFKADRYLEKAALPPFYALTERIDFKWVVGLMLFASIVITALLSTIPLMNIIEDTIELESKRRASSLAKTIAAINKEPLQNGTLSSASVAMAYQEPGVKKAFIMKQSNGEIITPSSMSGQYSSIPGVNEARKMTERPFHVFKANSTNIVAMHPIKFYSAAEGESLTKYYSVIVYNAQVLSIGSEKTLSLFIETLFLSLIFGVIIFYFLYKVVELPLKRLSKDFKSALQGQHNGELKTKILLNPLKDLYVIGSSMINRSNEDGSQNNQVVEVDRSIEVQNLADMLGYASIILSNEDESILEYNPLFEELTSLYDIKGQKIANLSDQALQQNLLDLIERSRISPDAIVVNDFEFSGIPYEVKMHPVMGSSSIAYFVCSFFPVEGGD
jgi:pSer/pThr/pTyr-binding forkhead associated (FHA) protein